MTGPAATNPNAVDLPWRGGDGRFLLRLGELFALQEKCKAGPMVIWHRLHDHTWIIEDVRDTIRLGLIGAGMPADKAMAQVKLHVDGYLVESAMLAQAIIGRALTPADGETVGKTPAADAETGPKHSTPTVASAAVPSSESAPAWDGIQSEPTAQPFGT